jgi:uncharacterized protein (TIGR00730 family)
MADFERVCVYCGSHTPARASYVDAAVDLGDRLARRGLGVVYGGASVGLMGAMADAALAAGGEVIGVIPDQLFEDEVAHDGLTQLHVVGSMHERKALMSRLADAFIALPGGYGTIEEVVEAVTWTQLGIHDKPVGLLDVEGYFEHLLAFVDRAVDDGLVSATNRDLLLADADPVRLLDRLERWAGDPALSRRREGIPTPEP